MKRRYTVRLCQEVWGEENLPMVAIPFSAVIEDSGELERVVPILALGLSPSSNGIKRWIEVEVYSSIGSED